jgi:hypothetical protein
MNDLKGVVGEVHATVTVTRATTGKVETYDVVGFVNEEQLKQLEAQNGSHSQHSS